MRHKVIAICAGILLFAVVAQAQGETAPRIKGYGLTIIEPLPGHTHVFLPLSSSVNQPSRAAGYSWHLSQPPLPNEQFLTGVPFEWRDGVQIPLALLSGWPGAFAFGMNNRGDIIGTANKLESNTLFQTPVLWSHPNRIPQNLGLLPGALAGAALGINSQGHVVGSNSGPTGPRPFIWQDGVMSELPRPGDAPNGQAFSINDAGEIAGVSGIAGVGPYQATLWDKRGQAYHLGTLGGPAPVSQAYGINNNGQVVGFSITKLGGGGTQRGFLWDRGMMYDLGTLGGLHSIAYGINNSTQVVGISLNAQGQSRPFVWENGLMFNLNDLIPPTPDTVLLNAYHINNRGCISGLAQVRGITRGFLLTPER